MVAVSLRWGSAVNGTTYSRQYSLIPVENGLSVYLWGGGGRRNTSPSNCWASPVGRLQWSLTRTVPSPADM